MGLEYLLNLKSWTLFNLGEHYVEKWVWIVCTKMIPIFGNLMNQVPSE